LKDAYLKIKSPRKPHTPLFISAFGPKALQLTGEIGDGWIVFAHTPQTYENVLNEFVKPAAHKAGRDLEDIEPMLVVPVALSKDRNLAYKAAASQAKDWIVLSPDNMMMIAPTAKHELGRQPYTVRAGEQWVRRLSSLAHQIPDEAAVKTALWGDTDQIIKQIEDFRKSGCRHLLLYPVPPESFFRGVVINFEEWAEVMRIFGEKIIPHFKT
jgi:alkanesulfonate monooxygenase SsuD/methylene tetrahydromethanopterin reductase-like flavin-dependent oxidoreductase (luciferase family)